MARAGAPRGALATVENVCLRVMSGFPVLFVSAVVIWSWYVYVIVVCGKQVESVAEKVLFLFVYHVLLILFGASYYRAINTFPGTAPEQFHLSDAEIEIMEEGDEDASTSMLTEKAKGLPIRTKLATGGVRYCDRCKVLKPDRSHHCSICRQCVLKMDHHCPWVNNCVGYGNYKFFILFLFYTMLLTVYVASSTCPYFISSWRHASHQDSSSNSTSATIMISSADRINVIFVFFIAVLFCFSVASLFFFHLYLLLNNQTTLESGRKNFFDYGPDKNGFHLGWRRNIEQVMGREPLFWILPINRSLGNGVEFPLRMSEGERESLLSAEEGRGRYSGEESS